MGYNVYNADYWQPDALSCPAQVDSKVDVTHVEEIDKL